MPRLPAALLLVALLGGATTATAQRVVLEPFGPADGVGSVSDASLAPDGTLWTAGSRGLLRYDGARFTRIAVTGHPREVVLGVAVGANGDAWAWAEGGLHHVRADGVVSELDVPDALTADLRSRVAGWVTLVAMDDGLVVGSVHGGVWRRRGARWTRLVAAAEERPVQDVVATADGDLWVLVGDRLGQVAGGRVQWLDTFPSARHVRPHPEGLWVLTGRGLYIRRREGAVVPVLDESHRSWFGQPDVGADGTLAMTVEARWDGAATASVAVVVVSPEGRVGPRLTTESGLRTAAVAEVTFDRDGGLWVSSPYGLDRLDLPIALVETSLPTQHGIHTLRVGPGGTVWASTWGGVFRVDRVGSRPVGLLEGTGPPAFPPGGGADWMAWDADGFVGRSLDREGRLRLGGVSRLFLARLPDGRALYADVASARRTGAASIAFADGRVLWPGAGHRLDVAGRPDGRIWVAAGGVLDALEGDSLASESSSTPPSVRAVLRQVGDVEVRRLALDRWGRVWAATRAGLAVLDERRADEWTVRLLGRADGLLDDLVYSLHVADGERLWVSSARGVQGFRLRPGAPVLDPIPLPGLLARLPTEAVVDAVEGRDGALWVAPSGPPRLLRFDWRAAEAPAPPALRPLSLHVNGHAVGEAAQGRVRLRADTSRMEVSFAPVSLRAGRGLVYEYRLRGRDAAWTELAGGAALRIEALPPGRYALDARARAVDGQPGPTQTLHLHLVPPFWRAGWFLAACLVALAGAGGAGVWRRQRWQAARRRELEALVAERTAELEAAKATTEGQARRLAAVDRAKSRFFAHLSHELRTPLTLIVGPVRDARRGRWGDVPPDAAAHLGVAERSAERLLRRVAEFLDLARLDVGPLRLRTRPTDLVGLLRGLVEDFGARAEDEGVALSLAARPARIVAPVDRDRVEEAVSNLIANALRFTPAGGRVRVSVAVEASEAVVVVRDSGPGIAPDFLPDVFERFWQGPGGGRAAGHAGLGLGLVREIAERHGGSAAVASELGFGATFTLRLPLDAAALPPDVERLDEEAQDRTRERSAGGGDLAGTAPAPPDAPLVLLVEDDADLRAYLRACLGDRYRIEEAADGEVGVERARALRPALVISDVMMPRLGGLALCRRLREEPDLGDLPVLLLTARSDEACRLEGLHLADDYLTKPFSTAELCARAENLIEVRRRLRAQYSGEVVVRPAEVVVPAEEAAWLAAVTAAVEARLDDPDLSVDGLAETLAVSTRTLQRRLREASGLTPVAFVRTLRLERAADLLRQRAGSVAEVARAVGFRDPDYFARVFRQGFGVPPSAFADATDDVAGSS